MRFIILWSLFHAVVSVSPPIKARISSDKGPYFPEPGPKNITVSEGSVAYLPCVVEQLGNYSVSWIRIRDFQILAMNDFTYTSDSRISVDTKSENNSWTLLIRDARLRDSGVYECQISTSPWLTSMVKLEVLRSITTTDATVLQGTEATPDVSQGRFYPYNNSLPTFDMTLPRNTTAIKDSNAYLHCIVHNIGNHTLTWIRDKDLHILTVDRYTYTADSRFEVIHKPNSNSWILKINNVQPYDGGRYECQVNTDSIDPITFPVWLNVYADLPKRPPTIPVNSSNTGPYFPEPGPKNITVYEGSEAYLRCAVEQLANYTVVWKRTGMRNERILAINAILVTRDKRLSVDVTQWTLKIQDVTESDTGVYVCLSSARPESISEFNLEVLRLIKPTLILGGNIEADNVKEGDDIYFECKFKQNHPLYNITWEKDGQLLTQDLMKGVRVSNESLVLQKIDRSHSGNYTCGIHHVISNPVALAVKYKPKPTVSRARNLEEKDIIEGDDVYLECSVEANPNHHKVSWYHDGNFLRHEISREGIMEGVTLTLQNVNSNHSGNYTCVAYNSIGRGISKPVLLEVKSCPSNKFRCNDGRCVSLTWDCDYDDYNYDEMDYTETQMIVVPETKLKNITVHEGSVAYLQCAVQQGHKNYVMMWKRTGMRNERLLVVGAILVTRDKRLSVDDTQRTLKIQNVTENDTGVYVCLSSAHTKSISEFNLEVLPGTSPILTLGDNIEADNINEGDDIYFECKFKSNYPQYNITWEKDGKLLPQDLMKGVILVNASLVLQRVDTSHSGNYTCRTHDGISKPLLLAVKFTTTTTAPLSTTPSDRNNETSGCPSDKFRCNDGWCLSLTWKCDGFNDCNNGEDEVDCDSTTTTPPPTTPPPTTPLDRSTETSVWTTALTSTSKEISTTEASGSNTTSTINADTTVTAPPDLQHLE